MIDDTVLAKTGAAGAPLRREGPHFGPLPEAATPPRCVACPVRPCGLCGNLGRDLAAIAGEATRLDLPAGATLWEEGRDGYPCGILVHGLLRSVYHGAGGRRHVMSLTWPGELIGRHLMRPGLTLEAATDVRICRVSQAGYAWAVRCSPAFRDLVRRQTETDLERVRYFTLALAALGADERLAAFLTLMTTTMPWRTLPAGGGILTLTLRRADIADLLAISIESISRITHRWERAGLIRILDPRHIEIRDPARLARIGKLEGEARVRALFALDQTADPAEPSAAARRGPRPAATPAGRHDATRHARGGSR